MSTEISLIVAALTEQKTRLFEDFPPTNARFFKHDVQILPDATLPLFRYDFYDAVIKCNDGIELNAHNLMMSTDRMGQFPELKTEEGAGEKTVYFVDLPFSCAQIMLDYLYWRPIHLSSVHDADVFIKWLKKPFGEIVGLLKKALLKVMKPQDSLTTWKLFHELDFFEVVDYCVYHFPLEYKKDGLVTEQFRRLPLKDVVCLLSDNWLNVQSEVEVVALLKDWISHNPVDEKILKCLATTLKVTDYNVDSLRLATADMAPMKAFIETKRTNRRFQRDFIVFFGLYDRHHSIAYVLDMERREFVRTPKLDNPNREVTIPNFVSTDDAIYQVGGCTDLAGFALSDVFRLDKKTLVWERRSSIPIGRTYAAITAGPKNKIFFIGGHAQFVVTRMQCCDSFTPAINAWRKLPDLRVGLYKAACVFYDDKLYVTGGTHSNSVTSDAVYLTQETKDWKPFSPLSFPRASHQMVVFNNKLYAMGGQNAGGILQTMEMYMIELGGNWKMATDMLKPRTDFTATVFQDKIFVFGGETSLLTEPLLYTVDCFDGENWSPFCVIPADLTPISAMAFPMLPNVEEVASRMFASPTVEEPESSIKATSARCQRHSLYNRSDDSGNESDDEFSGGSTPNPPSLD